jgi:hypothetical protein
MIGRLLLAGIALGTLYAQPSNGYIFFAPGGVSCCGHTSMTLQFGAGGEAVLGAGVGIGAELSALGPREFFGDSVVGVFSPNGYYHFVHGKNIKADPFVTGGYTLFFRSGHVNLFNFGAGLNYWLRRSFGVRFEIRDQVHTTNGPSVHWWGARVGLVF